MEDFLTNDPGEIEQQIEDIATDALVQGQAQPCLIVKLCGTYGFEHLKEYARRAFQFDGRLRFLINQNLTVKGKVTNALEEYRQKVNLCFSASGRTGEGIEYSGLYFFDERVPKGMKVEQTLSGEFFLHHFISQHRRFILLSPERLDPAEYTVSGTLVELRDLKEVGAFARLSLQLPLVFVHTITPRIIKYRNHRHLIKAVKRLHLDTDKLFSFVFKSNEPQDIIGLGRP